MSFALSIVSGGLITPAAQALTPDTATALPVTSFTDLVLDEAHGHLFVSALGNSGILVRSLSGAAVTTIANEPGVRDLALSPDGATLYAVLASNNAIAAIDTTTLLETARYFTGAQTCPTSVADVSGKLWFTYGCDEYQSDFGVVDPSADPPTTTLGLLPFTAGGFLVALSTPAKPGMVVVGGNENSPPLRVYDVSSGTAVLGPNKVAYGGKGASLTADGSRVVNGAGQVFLTSDLSSDGTYDDGGANSSTGYTTGPGGVAAASMFQSGIIVFRGDRSRVRTYSFGSCCDQGISNIAQPTGLAFSSDGSKLYAVTADYLGKSLMLRVLHDPLKTPAAISLTKPTSATINHAFTIYGKLTSALPVTAGQTISVTRDSAYGTVVLPARVTGAAGSFTITDTVTRRGAYGYRATWAGDAQHPGTTLRITFAVHGLATAVTVTTGSGPYAYGARPLVVAHLSTTKVRVLRVYVQPYQGTKVLLKQGTVDAHGNLSVPYTMSRRTTFTASFGGDDTYEPKWIARILYSHAKVSSVLQGYYGTSGAYKLYRTSKDPLLLISVAPNNAKTCVQFFSERYDSGAWHKGPSLSCFGGTYLDSYSRTGAVLITDAPAGSRYRLRGFFIGSYRNVATYGAWQYVKFTA